jgi:hypothetical protein
MDQNKDTQERKSLRQNTEEQDEDRNKGNGYKHLGNCPAYQPQQICGDVFGRTHWRTCPFS